MRSRSVPRQPKIAKFLHGERYEFGRIIASGMIGIVLIARDVKDPICGFRCIKRMMFTKMAEKNIYPSIKREIQILYDLRFISGAIRLLDMFHDEESLNLVFPYYPRSDLYRFSQVTIHRTLAEWKVQHICKELVRTLIKIHA